MFAHSYSSGQSRVCWWNIVRSAKQYSFQMMTKGHSGESPVSDSDWKSVRSGRSRSGKTTRTEADGPGCRNYQVTTNGWAQITTAGVLRNWLTHGDQVTVFLVPQCQPIILWYPSRNTHIQRLQCCKVGGTMGGATYADERESGRSQLTSCRLWWASCSAMFRRCKCRRSSRASFSVHSRRALRPVCLRPATPTAHCSASPARTSHNRIAAQLNKTKQNNLQLYISQQSLSQQQYRLHLLKEFTLKPGGQHKAWIIILHINYSNTTIL